MLNSTVDPFSIGLFGSKQDLATVKLGVCLEIVDVCWLGKEA